MTSPVVSELRELLAKADERWEVEDGWIVRADDDSDERWICDMDDPALDDSRTLIVTLHNAAPGLLARLEHLEAELAALRRHREITEGLPPGTLGRLSSGADE